jgi:hypothetical protein
MFGKWNVSVNLVYVNDKPRLDMTFEDENGNYVELDHFLEGRVKAYNIRLDMKE